MSKMRRESRSPFRCIMLLASLPFLLTSCALVHVAYNQMGELVDYRSDPEVLRLAESMSKDDARDILQAELSRTLDMEETGPYMGLIHGKIEVFDTHILHTMTRREAVGLVGATRTTQTYSTGKKKYIYRNDFSKLRSLTVRDSNSAGSLGRMSFKLSPARGRFFIQPDFRATGERGLIRGVWCTEEALTRFMAAWLVMCPQLRDSSQEK